MKKLITQLLSLVILVVLVVALLPASVPAQSPQAKPATLSFATLPMGGTYYLMSAGIAQVIEKYTQMKVTVEPSTGPLVWTPRIKSGDVDLSIINARDTYEAWSGTGDYAKIGKTDIALLGYGLGSRFVFFTRPDSGIKSIQDLNGKRIMYKTPGTPISNEGAVLVLEYYNLMDKVKDLPGGTPTAKAQALIEKRTDAYWCPVGTHIRNLTSSVGVVVLDVAEECSNAINKKYPWWVSAHVYKGEFGLKEDHRLINVINDFYCRRALSEETVYAIMKAVYEHPNDLKAIHRMAGTWTLDRAVRTLQVIPFHPGAIKYYKEKGVWTEKLEAKQKELLSK
jgi:TRAP transporter TAXI family solute receptor